MQDEWRKSRQLNAVSRLRAMQRERAELLYNRTRRELAEAEHRLSAEQLRYDNVQANNAALGRVGAMLDPSQHEQRLLAQAAAFQRLKGAHQTVIEARGQSCSAREQLLKCKVNEDLIDKARDRVQLLLGKAVREYEAIDIFDAQQARRVGHGS